MDAHHFDALARSLSLPGSRRSVLGGLLLGALGLLGTRTDKAAAKKKKPCPPCKKRKQGKCKGVLPDGTACAGGTCQRGSCVARVDPPPADGDCPPGQKPCGGSCIPNNQCCTDGDCPAATPRCCSGACVDVLTDVKHCGRCGAGCLFNEQCSVGSCRCDTRPGSCGSGGLSCCPPLSCSCNPVNFLDPVTCDSVPTCPPGVAVCVGTTAGCGFDRLPSRACCPAGTICDDGACRYSSTPCVEDLTAYCQLPGERRCGVWPGPCGRPVDCGSCSPGPTPVCGNGICQD
jgi:hypothetical protein